jgi:hypothetical protein
LRSEQNGKENKKKSVAAVTSRRVDAAVALTAAAAAVEEVMEPIAEFDLDIGKPGFRLRQRRRTRAQKSWIEHRSCFSKAFNVPRMMTWIRPPSSLRRRIYVMKG